MLKSMEVCYNESVADNIKLSIVLPLQRIPLLYERFYDIMKLTDRVINPDGCNNASRYYCSSLNKNLKVIQAENASSNLV